MSGTVLDARDTIVSTTDLGSAFKELIFGEADINPKPIESEQPSCECHKVDRRTR